MAPPGKCVVFTSVLFSLISTILSDFPFRNTSLPWNKRVEDLVGRLKLEEIVLQMSRGGRYSNGPAPPIDRLNIGPYSWNTECLRGDLSAGPATSFPQAFGLAATFDAVLIKQIANATAYEVRAKYNNYTKHKEYGDHKGLSCFSPVINIARHPLWGRIQETYGEDPYLSGTLAASFVTGLQGNHPRYVTANAGCKHFDAYAGPENIPSSRSTFDAKVSDRDLRMTFLPAFHECIQAGTYSLMCSYNSINGVPACANKKLLTDILRTEWNFTGYVISDQSAVEKVYDAHHYTKDMLDTAIACVNSGLNLELSSNLTDNVMMQTTKAVKQGNVTMKTVKARVSPLFYTRMRLGEFDPPEMNPYSKLDLSIIQSQEHQELSLKAAAKSFVLLKNENRFLPLKEKIDKLAVVGPFGDNPIEIYGSKSPDVSNLTVTPRYGLSKIARLATTFASGCLSPACTEYDPKSTKQAIDRVDMVVVCLGTGNEVENEAHDRSELTLPGQQLRLLQDAVTFAADKPVILLLFNAGPLDITWAVSNPAIPVIVECFFPAQTTGTALYHLFVNSPGSNPGGRLPITWPKSMSQVPPMEDYTMEGRTYRYFNGDPLFPFGYGLSYTTFHYSDLLITPSTPIKPCSSINIDVFLENTGDVTGDEVTQFYLSWKNASIPVPKWQLVGVSRTQLQSKTFANIAIIVPPRLMAVYTNKWVIEPGVYTVYAGGQQPHQSTKVPSNVLRGHFTVDGHTTPLSQCQ
ncbi:uncharacterized protein LOC100375100 [Saccoglossus kowalevskii]|uniref:Probable beta-D-xylosidase 6-like n=1 Tax=Saccoglossus kowalevskii TaxID=10224 RepID=A0ABM0GYH4_SACKO|nr:PREDICTED: probable beta-D-xylosidase 6-like [Saccoglossus kowalevskii]